jgi:hypothetical protein
MYWTPNYAIVEGIISFPIPFGVGLMVLLSALALVGAVLLIVARPSSPPTYGDRTTDAPRGRQPGNGDGASDHDEDLDRAA